MEIEEQPSHIIMPSFHAFLFFRTSESLANRISFTVIVYESDQLKHCLLHDSNV